MKQSNRIELYKFECIRKVRSKTIEFLFFEFYDMQFVP